MATNKVYSISDQEFIDLIKNSNTMAQVSLKLGYKTSSGRHSYDVIRKRIKELNISIEHFKRVGNQYTPVYSLDEILVENSNYTNMSSLKKRLLAANKIEYKCAICGNTGTWLNKKLVLQLDHINGNHRDHRLQNLRFLCPNCHSQTDTFCTRQPRAKSDNNQ